jgi:hypothetical protein
VDAGESSGLACEGGLQRARRARRTGGLGTCRLERCGSLLQIGGRCEGHLSPARHGISTGHLGPIHPGSDTIFLTHLSPPRQPARTDPDRPQSPHTLSCRPSRYAHSYTTQYHAHAHITTPTLTRTLAPMHRSPFTLTRPPSPHVTRPPTPTFRLALPTSHSPMLPLPEATPLTPSSLRRRPAPRHGQGHQGRDYRQAGRDLGRVVRLQRESARVGSSRVGVGRGGGAFGDDVGSSSSFVPLKLLVSIPQDEDDR